MTLTPDDLTAIRAIVREEMGAAKPAAPRSTPSPGGMVFPNYGKAKGQPIAGASLDDLNYYANGARRSIADPAKARWHDKERVLLGAIEQEIASRQGGGGESFAPPSDEDSIPF